MALGSSGGGERQEKRTQESNSLPWAQKNNLQPSATRACGDRALSSLNVCREASFPPAKTFSVSQSLCHYSVPWGKKKKQSLWIQEILSPNLSPWYQPYQPPSHSAPWRSWPATGESSVKVSESPECCRTMSHIREALGCCCCCCIRLCTTSVGVMMTKARSAIPLP